MARARIKDEYGNEYDDPESPEEQPQQAEPNRAAPATADPDAARRVREEQARRLNSDLGVDGGNLESFLSGRNSYEGYMADQRARTNNAPSGQRPTTTASAGGSSAAYQNYLQPQQPQTDPATERLLALLESQQAEATAEKARQETERQQMRQMVMERLGQATAPVSEGDPGIKPLIDAQKLSLQRGAQRQRSAAVERAGARGLGDSGAMDTRINQIEQGRGESEGNAIAQIMHNELSAKRNEVMQLMDLATRSGDGASARALQAQLSTLDSQMRQQQFTQSQGQQNDQFLSSLGFQERAFDESQDSQRYRFDNDLAYRLAQLQLSGNQGSIGFLGGLY